MHRRSIRQVLATDPNRTRALDGMGEVCLARSDYGQAILYFNRALEAEKPDAASVLTHRGYAKLRSRDLAGAEADLRSALSVPQRDDAWISPRDDAWRYLGDVLVLRGDAAGALESLLNVMSTAEAFNEMGVTLMNVKQYQRRQGILHEGDRRFRGMVRSGAKEFGAGGRASAQFQRMSESDTCSQILG